MEHACWIYIFFAPLESIKFRLLKLKERYITHCIIFDKYRLSHIFSLYKLFKTIFLNVPQFSEMPLEVFWFTYQSLLKHNMKFLAMLVKSRSSVRLVLFFRHLSVFMYKNVLWWHVIHFHQCFLNDRIKATLSIMM